MICCRGRADTEKVFRRTFVFGPVLERDFGGWKPSLRGDSLKFGGTFLVEGGDPFFGVGLTETGDVGGCVGQVCLL